MTLGEFLKVCDDNQSLILFFAVAAPLSAFLARLFGKGEGHKPPWNYFYMVLLYLVAIPGIFVFLLDLYLIIFEQKSILEINLYTQVLPIIVMIVTMWLIRSNVSFDDIPGFGKIGSLFFLLTLLIALLWILEKTNIYVISFMPFHIFLLVLLGMIIGMRLLLKKVF